MISLTTYTECRVGTTFQFWSTPFDFHNLIKLTRFPLEKLKLFFKFTFLLLHAGFEFFRKQNEANVKEHFENRITRKSHESQRFEFVMQTMSIVEHCFRLVLDKVYFAEKSVFHFERLEILLLFSTVTVTTRMLKTDLRRKGG